MLAMPAYGHRLDEYLQATILSIRSNRIEATTRLVPGVSVAPVIIAGIDGDGDGSFSSAEQLAYAQRVLKDLVLRVDDHALPIRLVSASFPSIDQIQQGIGEIQIAWSADLPAGAPNRTLSFENHHLPAMAVYLVNTLVPEDASIHLGAQTRNVNQSSYQLNFTSGGGETGSSRSFSGFAGAFRLGVRHIAEGTDHLLFLLTLLLPAPLLAYGGRWRQRASVKRSLLQILRIVTAFTVGHSLTLVLSAFGLLRLPSRPVEVLIAVSILVSAVHGMRAIFPGREAVIAAFFGLIHGLAFASAITELGFSHWYRLVSILAFNLGIEAMQLAVVAAVLPSLLLLSRTAVYPFFRWAGALIAALASISWILERALSASNEFGAVVERAAHQGLLLAVILFALSLLSWIWTEAPGLRGLPAQR